MATTLRGLSDFLRKTWARRLLRETAGEVSRYDCSTCRDTGDLYLNQHERMWEPCPDCKEEGE